ncbi:MAG: hypothetical protein RRC34_09795 [Lentisphaeria bacterium]|nr:hypothetical protein [Lentisphaeria bacterium]
MQALKNNYEKFILGILLVAFVGSGAYWISYLQHVKHVASQGTIIDITAPDKPLPSFSDAEFQALTYLVSPDVTWGDADGGNLFIGRGYKQCAEERCQHWIAFKLEACPWCGTAQPPPKDTDPDPENDFVDTDGDGIPDTIEEKYPFLRADRIQDGWADEDGDGFFNREEFKYFRTLDETHDGGSMTDANIHPPLATHLRLIDVDRDLFSIRLTKVVMVKGQDKQDWEIHLAVRDDMGKIRTRFAKLGQVINGYRIADVEKKEERYYNKAVKDYMLRDASVITLEKEGEDPMRLTSGEMKYTGVVAKLVLDHYSPQKVQVLRPVRDGDTVSLTDSAGQTETYRVSSITDQSLTATRLINGQPGTAFLVGKIKRTDIPASLQSPPDMESAFDGIGMEPPNF